MQNLFRGQKHGHVWLEFWKLKGIWLQKSAIVIGQGYTTW